MSAPSISSSTEPKAKNPKTKKSIPIPNINTAVLVGEGTSASVATPSSVPSSVPSSELAKYQKMSDKEHILKKPDTYIGSIEMTEASTFVYDSVTSSIVERTIHYIPGLYKLFDEGAVNSRDHFVRQEQAIRDAKPNALPVTCIEFEISDDGTISITNDGNGIDVAQHPEHKLWIP